MNFIPSTEMKISLLPEQERWLSSKESIRKQCTREDVAAFDVFKDGVCVGFAALKELIALMKERYGAKFLTTTYI